MGYDLDGKKLLLCFNVIKYQGFKRDRNGTEADERNIINTFKAHHGFDVQVSLSGDVKRDDMIRAINDFVNRTSNKPHDIKMLTLVFMAHGLENDWIEFSDGHTIRLMKLLEPILGSPKFRGIPKLIICHFCRGDFMNSAAIMDNRALTDIVNGQMVKEMMKIVEKKNYEYHFPIPEDLKQHIDENKNSFNIQILGCRGAGKSTFVNNFMEKAGLDTLADTGCNETIQKTTFYEITEKITNIPNRYSKVFICDQPGIGGLKITEAGYLNKFGPGHFNFTLMLGEKGFNEMDMALLKHLLFNKKPLALVRTQCDNEIYDILDAEYDKGNEDMTFEDGLKSLEMTFRKYIKTQVLSKVKVDNLEIFFVGLPTRKYPDFEKMTRRVLSGEILEAVGMVEALESKIPDFE